jgi:lipoprotein-releasing system ATP-binding protein
MSDPVISLRGIDKVYDQGVRTQVLFGVDLDIAAGEFVALVGASGSGKSTLLNLVGLLDTPSAGRVLIAGRDAATLGEDERSRLRREHLGFIFQSHYLLPDFSVIENVFLPCRLRGEAPEGTGWARVEALIETVGLGEHRHKRPHQLSGGQQQRAAIVRALANQPRLVLADEPTGNLDSQTRDVVFRLMRDLSRRQGQAFLMVTHDPSLAVEVDRVVTISDGRIVAERRPGAPPAAS